MKVIKAVPSNDEPTVSLGSLKGGQVFRFSHLSFDAALKEDAFYMVVDDKKEGILLANLTDGMLMKRDKDHRVVIHNATISLNT